MLNSSIHQVQHNTLSAALYKTIHNPQKIMLHSSSIYMHSLRLLLSPALGCIPPCPPAYLRWASRCRSTGWPSSRKTQTACSTQAPGCYTLHPRNAWRRQLGGPSCPASVAPCGVPASMHPTQFKAASRHGHHLVFPKQSCTLAVLKSHQAATMQTQYRLGPPWVSPLLERRAWG